LVVDPEEEFSMTEKSFKKIGFSFPVIVKPDLG
jgi:hypothetical protein